ncbi:MAG: hypothetical protein O3B01_19320 [Planctomycetota bacterium]|nr:hypothetical protein [Planctomycetota bacterium]
MKSLFIFSSLVASMHAGSLHDIKVGNDRAPDCSSLESIVRTVTKDCKTDDEKVIALYNFLRYIHYHHAYPNERGGISALKFINVYGWGLCGGEHTVQAALWNTAGYKWRYMGWDGHTTVEVEYGGRWHYLDTFLKFYTWMPDPNSPGKFTIAGQEDIRSNPKLVSEAFSCDGDRSVSYHKSNKFEYDADGVNWAAPAFMLCGDSLSGVIAGVKTARNAGSPRGWNAINFDDPNYAVNIQLAAGYSLTLDWDRQEGGSYFGSNTREPQHTCGDKEYRNCPSIGPLLEPYSALNKARTWSNGTLLFKPDFLSDEFMASLKSVENTAWKDGKLISTADSGSFVVAMDSPYVVAKARLTAKGDASFQVSTDRGKTWSDTEEASLSEKVRGHYAYQLKVQFRKELSELEVASIVQHNQEALPYLAPGQNTITITGEDLPAMGKNRLVVTYAYYPGHRYRSHQDLLDKGAEIARAHYAKWDEKPVVVQKTIDKFPFTFEILVPTPVDKLPVYPRMAFLRREVLSPNQKPLPAPAEPSTPVLEKGQVLATLPSPWTMGTRTPQATSDKPTKKITISPAATSYVSKTGEVFPHHSIKWLKDSSQAYVLLTRFKTDELPAQKDIASAKLILYVHESHDRAPMEAAAVMLNAPFESGKPYDFNNLSGAIGSTTVAKGNGPGAPSVPPLRYEIDVTRAVRAWAKGSDANGLGLRLVPNRAIDDGWTVRFTPAQGKPVELEIARFVEK